MPASFPPRPLDFLTRPVLSPLRDGDRRLGARPGDYARTKADTGLLRLTGSGYEST